MLRREEKQKAAKANPTLGDRQRLVKLSENQAEKATPEIPCGTKAKLHGEVGQESLDRIAVLEAEIT